MAGKARGAVCAIVIDVRQWLTVATGCCHWLLPLVVATGPTASRLGGVALAVPSGSPLPSGQEMRAE